MSAVRGYEALIRAERCLESNFGAALHAFGDLEDRARCEGPGVVAARIVAQAALLTASGERVTMLRKREGSRVDVRLVVRRLRQTSALSP